MKKILKRGMSGLLAVLMAFTMLAGFGTTTAFAASETAESYMISFPRDGDAAQIYSEDAWGHSAKSYMKPCAVPSVSCRPGMKSESSAWHTAEEWFCH